MGLGQVSDMQTPRSKQAQGLTARRGRLVLGHSWCSMYSMRGGAGSSLLPKCNEDWRGGIHGGKGKGSPTSPS